MSVQTVGIIGLGAMGGSLAQALTQNGVKVIGFDLNRSNVALARSAGVDASVWQRGTDLVCDAVVIATPVRAIPEVLHSLQPQAEQFRFITDLGSVKRLVVRAAESFGLGRFFVGSHPLAGTHESGWNAARADTFANATVFLCSTTETLDQVELEVADFWHEVGARPEVVSAEAHDHLVARVSHLPQLTSNALAVALQSMKVNRGQLGRGGHDMTRLAGSDPEMWLDIAAANADMLSEPLDRMIEALAKVRANLSNKAGLQELLRASASWYGQ